MRRTELGRGGSFYASWSRGGVALAALALAVYLAGLWSIAPVDRDESRFAQASRQMFESVALPPEQRDPVLHSGGLAIPYYDTQVVGGVRVGKPRVNKPPLVYWLQAGSVAALTAGDPRRDAIWMYRIPSVLSALVAMLATWRLGLGMFDARAAWLGALLLGVCPLVAWEAHQARSDMLLLACCTLMQLALWRVWKSSSDGREKSARRTSWWMPLMFWAALGAGIMTKGPIAPLLALGTVLWLGFTTRRWRWVLRLRPFIGLLIVLAMAAPWVVLVARQIGLARYLEILNEEVVQRATVGSKEGHALPPGVHTLAALGLLFPASLALVQGFARGWKRGRPRRRVPGRAPEWFLIAWVVPFWVVFELVTSKLVHYTLPAYPALALLAGRAAWRFGPVNRRHFTSILAAWVVLGAAGLQFIAPLLAPGADSAAIMRYVRKLDPSGDMPVVSEHREDSMVFWTRGRVRRVSAEAMDKRLGEPTVEPWIAVIRRGRPASPQPTGAERIGRFMGGDEWTIGVVNRTDAQPGSGAP